MNIKTIKVFSLSLLISILSNNMILSCYYDGSICSNDGSFCSDTKETTENNSEKIYTHQEVVEIVKNILNSTNCTSKNNYENESTDTNSEYEAGCTSVYRNY